MIQKTIGLYNEASAHSPFSKDTLIIEVSNEHVACLVKSEDEQKVTAFEFFTVELDNNDWEEVFYELRTNSGLMDKSYTQTLVFYHVQEAVLVPAYKYNSSVNDAYLNLLFGEDDTTIVQAKSLTVEDEKIYVVYRVNQTLHETINRNFLSIQEYHLYNGILNFITSEGMNKEAEYMHINFYAQHCVISAFKNKQLQIIQSFSFTTADDVLYNILNVADKFKLIPATLRLVVAGTINTNEEVFKKLSSYFKQIKVLPVSMQQTSLEKLSAYPLHYFSPYFNLQA